MDFITEGTLLKQYSGDADVVYIPVGITEIMPYAFQYSRNIRKIVCSPNITKLHDYAFSGCREMEEIILPEHLKSIGEKCFSYCSKLKSLIIPDSVDKIMDYAFEYCIALENISIPECVTDLSDHIFNGCDVLRAKSPLLIFNHTCYGGSGNNGHVEIPDSVKHIAPSAFHDSSIVSVSIPGTISAIPERAFSNCKCLSRVTIAEGVKEIGYDAFTGCSALPTIELPNTLESLGTGCFSFCGSLNHMVIPPKITYLPCGLFDYCVCLSEIFISNAVTAFGSDCFNSCNFSEWELSENIKSIGSQCFGGPRLKKLRIGESVSDLPAYAFTYCTHLNDLYISDKITSCEKLNLSVSVPNLHISAKFISQLTPENKHNATLTFLRTHNTFSETGIKDWITYIRRKKIDVFQMLLVEKDLDLIKYFLNISSFSKKDFDCIKSLTDGSDIKESIMPLLDSCVVKANKPVKVLNSSNISGIEKIIRSTPKSASAMKKVIALEACILLGSIDDVKQIWAKLSPFEFLNRAICLCTQIGDTSKLKIILQSGDSFSDTEYYGPMKAKYDLWNDMVTLRNLIGPKFLRPKYVDWDKDWYDDEGLEDPHCPVTDLRSTVLSSINIAYKKSAGVVFTEEDLPAKSYNEHIESLKLIDLWNGGLSMSDFIAYALFHGRIALAKDMLESGYSLDPGTISYLFSVDNSESRRDVFYALSVSNKEDRNFIWKCIAEAAQKANEKIVLSSIILDYAEDLFAEDFFQILITECNAKKLKAKDLMETLIRKNQPHNLAFFLDSPLCHVKRGTLEGLIDLSKYLHRDDCTAELIKHI